MSSLDIPAATCLSRFWRRRFRDKQAYRDPQRDLDQRTGGRGLMRAPVIEEDGDTYQLATTTITYRYDYAPQSNST
jgi:hypothetical protein